MNNAQAARLTGPDLFTPLRLGPYMVPNRIVMAPLYSAPSLSSSPFFLTQHVEWNSPPTRSFSHNPL